MLQEVGVKRWFFLSLAVLICLSAASLPVTAADAVVTDMRVGGHAGKTRFVFDLTNRVRFGLFTLADPYRVVVDLPEVGWRLPGRPLPARTGLLKKLRYGLFKPGVSRVVLEMNSPAAIDSAYILEPTSANGYRIVIDLAPTSHQAFIKSTLSDGVKVTASVPSSTGMLRVPQPTITKPTAARAAARAAAPRIAAPRAAAPRIAAPRIAAIAQPAAVSAPSPFSPPPRKPSHSAAKRVIVIDPGHGGIDPGTTGVSGVYEKNIVLSAAREIKRKLEQSGRYRVVLTRERDIFIRLRDRVAIAREAGADLFISIHADATKNRKIRGLSVYTLSERASDKEAAALAEKENKSDLIAGINLSGESREVTNILIDLAQRESMNQSSRFASALVKELRGQVKVLRNTHRFAGFAVLKAPDIPSVLLELGFLSNRNEERALRSKQYRNNLAKAVVHAVKSYFTTVEEARRR